MLKIRKYIALAIVFLPLFLFKIVASLFIIEEGNAIYSYVPIEADVVIEVNTRNFIKEIAYQRIYEEEYFIEKVYPDPTAQPEPIIETGVNYFDRIVLFRETWPEEKVWSMIFSYTSKEALEKFAADNFPDAHLYYTDDNFVIFQISQSDQQDAVDEHFKRIAAGDSKPITEKINIRELFPRDKEINCYFAPQTTNPENQIIDGTVSLDFMNDEIKVDGQFIPVSDFNQNETIKYPINEEVAFSMRSSLNLFHSLYWFSNEKLSNIPSYDQMAFDYDGVNMFLCQYDSPYPFNSFPVLQMRFDIGDEQEEWQGYFDDLIEEQEFRLDTVMQMVHTPQGACFKYNVNDEVFEFMRTEVNLEETLDDSIYMEMRLDTRRLFDNTIVAADSADPRSKLELNLLLSGANSVIEDMRGISIMSEVNFKLAKDGENLKASGKVVMKEEEGNSMIECLFLGKGALFMLKEYM